MIICLSINFVDVLLTTSLELDSKRVNFKGLHMRIYVDVKKKRSVFQQKRILSRTLCEECTPVPGRAISGDYLVSLAILVILASLMSLTNLVTLVNLV